MADARDDNTQRAPEHDCPQCPRCKLPVGTPIKEAEVERFEGPQFSTLYCPACGAAWVGSDADLAQARKSWAAYEAKLAAEESAR